MRVWGAAAVALSPVALGLVQLVTVHRSGRGSRSTEIVMMVIDFIDWQDDGTAGGRVIMRGPVTYA